MRRPYARPDDPPFFPEANHARLPETGANACFAIGEYDAIGFSPFSLTLSATGGSRLTRAFEVLRQ